MPSFATLESSDTRKQHTSLPSISKHPSEHHHKPQTITLPYTKNCNMAEPQPSQIQEGDQAPSAIPGSNKSETAALNSLDNHLQSTNTSSTAALGKAMKNLNLSSDGNSEVKNVKVDMADAILLVSAKDHPSRRNENMLSDGVSQAEHLDISRARALELLKANDADPVKAMRAWVAT
jgi:hypothetical protein